jgi:hypothetical protein
MTASQPGVDSPASSTTPLIQRRGVIAAAWAAVIGLVLQFTTKPLLAAANMLYADTTASFSNTAVGPTVIIDSAGYTSTSSVFTGQSLNGSSRAGLQGVAGLRGSAPIRCGVFGDTGVAASAGVYGNANSDTVGVLGRAEFGGTGVLGQSLAGLPILGQVAAGSSANTIAIYGLNNSTYTGASPGAGGFGVYGLSARGHGLVGATAATGGAAVVGATNGVAGAFAGAFYGPVIVGGDLTVVGGAKSAAVPHPDGSHRRLYCMESPESWFEDFGKGQLHCGGAVIAIDPDFGAVADLSDYHVFLTEYGGHNDLSVAEQTPVGFRVEARDATSIARFSWRIVAKRRDIRGGRLEPVIVPPEPTLPPVPDVSAMTGS